MSDAFDYVPGCEEVMQRLLDYVFEQEIRLCLGETDESTAVLSWGSFSKMIKKALGEEYDFIYVREDTCVEIVNAVKRYSVGHIYGRPDTDYVRGDNFDSVLTFYHAISKGQVFLRNKRVAYILNEEQICCGTLGYDPFYVIDNKTSLIKAYRYDGSLIWTNRIEKNSIQTYRFNPMLNYPNKSFPAGLIVVTDGFNYIFFSKNDGEFYGEFEVKKEYKRKK